MTKTPAAVRTFLETIRRPRIGGNTLHEPEGQVEQAASTEEIAPGVTHRTASGQGGGEIAAHDPRKETIWPVGVDAVTTCDELLHLAPHAPAVARNRHLESC